MQPRTLLFRGAYVLSRLAGEGYSLFNGRSRTLRKLCPLTSPYQARVALLGRLLLSLKPVYLLAPPPKKGEEFAVRRLGQDTNSHQGIYVWLVTSGFTPTAQVLLGDIEPAS